MNAVTTPKDLIANWQDRHARLFGAHPIVLKHRLIETGLFDKPVLERLIERCPPEELGLVDRKTENGVQITRQGRLGTASGAEAIAAIEKGRIWMNIRRVMDWAPEYADLLDKVFAEFEARMPGFSTFKRNLGVLISSPGAKVFYHADIQGQSLWQISGVKTVRIYPNDDIFAPAESIEKILLRETTEDMTYEPWFDEYARAIELHPGEMATWPLYAPHRVDNGDMLNISVTMEHWTGPIRNTYAAHYGNGVLRRTVGLKNGSTADYGAHIYPKAALAVMWKKLGRQTRGEVDKAVGFAIDGAAANGIRELEA